MTREKVEAKLAALRQQQRQTQANAHAVEGAIQVCEQLLADWEDDPPPPKEDA